MAMELHFCLHIGGSSEGARAAGVEAKAATPAHFFVKFCQKALYIYHPFVEAAQGLFKLFQSIGGVCHLFVLGMRNRLQVLAKRYTLHAQQ